jgi:sugar O-acyltransferase (sialic acid O-acetyltransferase NeuD family)
MALKNRFIVLGAGGHARVLLETLRASGANVLGCLDPDRSLWKTKIEGVKILGGEELLDSYRPNSISLVNGVGGPGRRKVFARWTARGYRFPALTASSAIVASSAVLEDGVQVLTRAVVHPGASVGRNAVINTSAVIEHDCVIGDDAFIAPGVVLCGQVRIGRGAMIGAGAVVVPGVAIGDEAVVGAGSVVTRDIRGGITCWGIPARKKR